MISHKFFKPITLFILFIFIILLFLLGQSWGKSNHVEPLEIKMVDQISSPNPALKVERVECSMERPSLDLDLLQKDLALNFLGNSFAEIKEVLGEPQEQGYSSWYGPHNFMFYNFEKGPIRFCSPLGVKDKLAVSIFVGAEQEILGAKVGMTFAEIQDILGAPAFGPELGMGDLYYMDYFFSETTQTPEVFISFSADAINSPTHDAFIKWESFEYDKGEMM